MTPMIAYPSASLTGEIRLPGDKSISHRALLLAASATGESVIDGLLEATDVLATADALRALGAEIERRDGRWHVHGCGTGGLREPQRVLDMGNSGTGARLLMGLVASQPILTFFCGDDSLSQRPMHRVIEPLSLIGAAFWAREGGRLPLALRGATAPLPIDYRLPVASAQVKSAVLLAGLNAPGRMTVSEPQPTRDHTERLLRSFGAEVSVEELTAGGRRITLVGEPELAGRAVEVPGDVSSAAFPLVAALVVPGSRVTLSGVGINAQRIGLIETLQEMGARIDIVARGGREAGADGNGGDGEPIADLIIEAGPLEGVDVPETRVPAMIDEFPVLAVAAACARGATRMRGLAELRVKESDRLAAIVQGLVACGIRVDAGEDWIEVHGADGLPPGGGLVATHFDHRIAMAFLVLGLAASAPVRIDDGRAIATSFPSFAPLMAELGAHIDVIEPAA
ncbi:MAG: 3-phosphoshikimate 1-carboxyvinyltransferase [Rhodospirillales bacterium]|nr:3-phosphoshikimate 1-carboxyvinyltransferase [Rhodospirillales bacterium]